MSGTGHQDPLERPLIMPSGPTATASPDPEACPTRSDAVAVVTGATGGLGRACALALAAKGYSIVALARTPGALEDLKEAIDSTGGTASLAVLDLADAQAIANFIAAITRRWNRLDLVVHAAVHATPLAPVPHIDPDDLARALQVNVQATADLIRHAVPLLDASSTVIFFEDSHAHGKFTGAYGATKAAQIALARRWQNECQKIGPNIIIFQPERMATRTLLKRHPGIPTATLATPTAEAKRLLDRLRSTTSQDPDI